MAFLMSCRRFLGQGINFQRTCSLSRYTALLSPRSLDDLEKAKVKVTSLSQNPGNEALLKLYGLFKQASIGNCDTKRPGVMDFVGRAKWDAWNGLKDMPQGVAIDGYCEYVDELVGGASDSKNEAGSSNTYEEIIVEDVDGVRNIVLNRPSKYNAITYKMYSEIQQALEEAANIDSIRVAMLTGAGSYYCSGNDLSNFANIPPEGPQKLAATAKVVLKDFVSAFIRFPKVLVGAVNGPAVGIAVTTLGLCDMVYSSENATFHTPFTSLGQSPEACSSLIFPRIMGAAQANEVLLGGKKLTSIEAFERGLVTRVLPEKSFQSDVKDIVSKIAKLPPQSLLLSKKLIRSFDIDLLHRVNSEECELLEERWLSDECMQAILAFMQRKN